MTSRGLATLTRQRASARRAAIKRLQRTFCRLQLLFFPLINEVTGPRYALHCFATHVETKSAPWYPDYSTNRHLKKRLLILNDSNPFVSRPSLRCYALALDTLMRS